MALRTISATYMRDHWGTVLDELERTGKPIIITKRGRPVVQLCLPSKDRPSVIGAMKGGISRYDRPTAPAVDPDEWEAKR